MSVQDRLTPEGRRFYQQLEELAKMEVRIGYQAGEATDDRGVDMCDIAAWNELGTSGMPSRPFLRQTMDEHGDEITAFCKAQAAAIADGGSAETCLKRIGIFLKGLVQNQITEGSFEPNAPSTIKKKKSDKPLIDTGLMRELVNYFIKQKGGG